jgi:hypothetical protein
MIQSEIPTPEAGLDKMTGSFSCPLLSSSETKLPIAIRNGQFTIFIIVES